METETETVLEMIDVCKSFYGDGGIEIKANDHVNFNLKRGEIHALLGENGAGKSTLVSNLFHKPDSGKILLHGEEVSLDNPIKALKYGIAIAHQDLSKSLVERHTIAENILSISQGFFLSLNKVEDIIKKALIEYNLGDLNPRLKVWKLSGGEKQRVEILKALITNPDILILDEPTSMLTPLEVEDLFRLLKKLRAEGKSIVLITHHLEEALDFSDRITILRKGRVIDTIDTKKSMKAWGSHSVGINKLAELMVGREVLYGFKKKPLEAGKTLLEVRSLRVKNDMGDLVVHGVSLDLKENEILGIAGIAGNGQRELVEAILNLRHVTDGRIIIRGLDMTNQSIKKIKSLGVAYIPEDRRKAMVLDLPVRINLLLNSYLENPGLFIDQERLIEETDALIEQYSIDTPSPLTPMRSLSGGNRQKVVVARELSRRVPEGHQNIIVIAENPTIGLDIHTTQFVRQELLRMREEGAAVLLISSDLSEILTLSDRIAVIYKGELIGIVDRQFATRENIGLMMGGVSPDKHN